MAHSGQTNRQIRSSRAQSQIPVPRRFVPAAIPSEGPVPENSGQFGSGLFSSASNIGIGGGSIISAGGNVTIVHARPEEYHDPSTIHGVDLQRETPRPMTDIHPSGGHRGCDVYYRNLLGKKRGSPLWIPEPSYNLPMEYQRSGVSIGDVGVLSASGSFTFFFNICLPADHPINQGLVPEGFIPLYPPLAPIDVQAGQEFGASSYVTSERIEISRRQYSDSLIADLIFQSSAEEGAILTLPRGANSEDVVNTFRLRAYVAQHIENWYKYVIGVRGCEARNGDIRLVIGCDKADTWGMAAFVKSSETVRLKFQPTRRARNEALSQSYKWEYSGSFDAKTGPDPQRIESLRQYITDDGIGRTFPEPIYNQCMFVRTMNANLREDIWREIVHKLYADVGLDWKSVFGQTDGGSSGIRQTESSNISSGRTQMQARVPGNAIHIQMSPPRDTNVHISMMPHPSNDLNRLLWDVSRTPRTKTFITEDSDWISVVHQDDKSPPDPSTLYNRITTQKHDLITNFENDFTTLSIGPDVGLVESTPSAMSVDNPTSLVGISNDNTDRGEADDRPRLHRSSSRQSLGDRTNYEVVLSLSPVTQAHPADFSLSREEETRRKRIEIEQRRQDELRDGYARLRGVLPPSSIRRTRVTLLSQATSYIMTLKNKNSSLHQRLAELEQEVQALSVRNP